MGRPTITELRGIGWKSKDFSIPVMAQPIVTLRKALLLGFTVLLLLLGTLGSIIDVSPYTLAVMLAAFGVFLAVILIPPILSPGAPSFVALHERLHAVPLWICGAKNVRIYIFPKSGGACMAPEFVMARNEFVFMSLFPAVAIGLVFVGLSAFAWIAFPADNFFADVIKNLLPAFVIWHTLGACKADYLFTRHVWSHKAGCYADVREQDKSIVVRAWTAPV